MICKNCGHDNKDEFKFCTYCGSKLNEIEKVKVCPKCGAENKEEDTFCWMCGQKLDEVVEAETTFEEPIEEGKTPKRCKICGTLNPYDKKYCALCGSQLSAEAGEEMYVSNIKKTPAPIEVTPFDSLAVKTLVFGIIAIASASTTVLFPLAFVMGIIAIILGIVYLVKSEKKAYKSKAITGIVLGAIGIFASIFIAISLFVLLNSSEFKDLINQLMQNIEEEPVELVLRILRK